MYVEELITPTHMYYNRGPDCLSGEINAQRLTGYNNRKILFFFLKKKSQFDREKKSYSVCVKIACPSEETHRHENAHSGKEQK